MSELDKTIEELEAEVLAELEEAADQPDDSGGKADAPAKVKKNAEDGAEETLNNASPEGSIQPIEKAVNRLNAICSMYVKFENVYDTHGDMYISRDSTAEQQIDTVYGSVLIDAVITARGHN